MKQALSLALFATVTTEFATEGLHEAQFENLHMEQKTTSPIPSTSTTNNLSSGGNPEPLANFRSKTFAKEMRKANISNDKFATHQAWLATAHAMIRDRALEDWQRVMQYEIMKFEIETIHHRTSGKINCSGVLPALAAALHIPSASVPG